MPQPQKPSQLRDYQVKVIEQIHESWAKGHRSTIVQMPTGSGKTHVFAQIAKDFGAKGKRVLVLTHRHELVRQAADKIVAISDLPIGIVKARATPNYDAPIQIATIGSLGSRIKNVKNISLVIVDECHHAPATQWQETIELFPTAKILGFSATPVRWDGKGFQDLFDDIICGEDIRQLIDRAYLSDYHLYASPTAMATQDVSTSDGDYSLKDLAQKNNPIELAAHLIDSYHRHAKGLQAIVFAINVDHSISIAKRYNLAGIPAVHIDGNTSTYEREVLLNKFRLGEVKVLSNCNLLDEGIDLPNVGCVQIARPTKSLSRYMQMLGRGLRPDKDRAILIDHTQNYQIHGLPDEKRSWGLDGVETKLSKIGVTPDRQIVRIKEFNSRDIVELDYITLVQVGRFNLPDEAVNRYVDKTVNTNQLSKEFGVSHNAITASLKRQGIPTRNSREQYNLPDEAVQRYVDKTVDINQLSKEFGVSHNAITASLKRQGIPIRNPTKQYNLPDEAVQRYVDKTVTAYQLSKELGVSGSTIIASLKRQGIPTRNPAKPN